MKNITINKGILFGLIVTVVACAILVFTLLAGNPKFANATAPAGLNAQVATSSTLGVGPGNNMYAFGTTTNESRYQCAARVISTTGFPILISFASVSSTTLSTSVGFVQSASTTVAYDGGLYGCGYVTIRGLYSSTTITIAETH